MASVGSLASIIETKGESSLFLLQYGNQRRHGSSLASLRPRKSWGFSNLDDSPRLLSFCCHSETGGARLWSFKSVRATGPNAGDGASEPEDALQATIEKSKKVLAMQNNLLQQIAERRKMISSIKNSTVDIDKDERENTVDYLDTDLDSYDQVKIDSARNDSRSTSSSTLSTVNKLPETPFSPPSTTPTGDPSTTLPRKKQLSGNENKASSLERKDPMARTQRNESISVKKPSSNIGIASQEESTGSSSGVDWSKPLPSFLSTAVAASNENDDGIVEKRNPNAKYTHGESNEPDMVEEKPPPLAGQNVMNIILVAAECAPFIKTGGLGDVAGSLPKALARRGHRVMVVLPRYNDFAEAKDTGVKKRYKVDGQDMEVLYFQTYIDGVDFVFIDSPIFRHISDNIYGGNRMDILKRMVLFCKVAVEVPWHVPCGGVCYGDGNLVFIANDWHTALLPVYLKAYYRDHGLMKYARSVLVIHNIAHQGRGPVEDFFCTELPEHYMDMFKFYDPVGGEHFNIFAAGLKAADRIVTVSHGYAWELKTSEGGWGLHGIINESDWKLRGIVNGIDTKDWSPQYDVYLQSDGYRNYSLDTLHIGKPQCKAALQKELNLPVRPDVPVIGFIGRLDHQKGVDLIAEAVPWMMGQDVQLVMLGSGRPDLEQLLKQFESQYRDKARGWVGFSVKTAHRITAGADILLMPSRFEPCGLNQLYAMSYGTVPVVHAVGGLRDTVQPFNPYNESGLGWTFDSAETNKLINALGNCLMTFREYKKSWEGLQRRGMSQDLSWDYAAEKYEEVLVAAKYQW